MKQSDTGLVSEYTVEGTLLGHIIQGLNYVDSVGKTLAITPEKTMLLKHMILSHHYIPEHGSPKPPAFPEAELLHYLDILDARMYGSGPWKIDRSTKVRRFIKIVNAAVIGC